MVPGLQNTGSAAVALSGSEAHVGSSWTGDQACVSPRWQADHFTTEPPGRKPGKDILLTLHVG